MPFRRRFPMRRSFRRRRRLPETYTILQCRTCANVCRDSPCVSPFTDVFEILTMNTKKSPAFNEEISSPSDKFLTVDGIKFQSEFHSDPNDWATCSGLLPFSALNATFFLTIWEALIVLPFAQGSQVPAYVPNLTAPTFQVGDLADRVLWKRLTLMPMWGLNTTGGVSQLEATMRDEGHGPVVVKSRVRLDDRHGLYMVRCFVHNLVTGAVPSGCASNCDTNPFSCSIPVNIDEWFKVFYHTRK